MTEKAWKRQKLPKPVTITLLHETYQPRKAETAKECDMPEASVEEIRNAFFRPVKVRREGRG